MNREELIKYIDQIEQEVRDIDGDEDEMKTQLIDLADSILATIDNM